METRESVHTQPKTNRHLHLCQGVGLFRELEWPAALRWPYRWECKVFCAHVFENLRAQKIRAQRHFATGTRGFATRKLGAVATLHLKPEDQGHHCDQMNIPRGQIRKAKIRNGFRFQLGRKRAIWVSLGSWACSLESTENCRRAQRSAGFVVWHLALCG